MWRYNRAYSPSESQVTQGGGEVRERWAVEGRRELEGSQVREASLSCDNMLVHVHHSRSRASSCLSPLITRVNHVVIVVA